MYPQPTARAFTPTLGAAPGELIRFPWAVLVLWIRMRIGILAGSALIGLAEV